MEEGKERIFSLHQQNFRAPFACTRIDTCNHTGYNKIMIKSFCDERTKDIFNGRRVQRLDSKLARKARRRLELLNAAVRLEDMYFPPSNHFHALQGDNPTRYSIRVDQRWRITYEWREGDAFDVCFEDYH